MIRKYGTINEEVNRIKSLFGESRLYGNLAEQSDEIDNSNSIVCTESGCKGEYSGVEHNTDVKPSDVAHQFSNTMSTDVGNKLKELYEEGIYVKVDFDGIEMTTEGMNQKDDVVYKLNIPFKKVDEKCKAMTSFDHVGGWGHSPKLEARKGELSGVLLSGDELDISELKKTTEGLEEYWIQWRNKNTQLECEDIEEVEGEDYESFHDNGKLKTQGTIKDGLNYGEWKQYYDNGQLEEEGKYVNGEEEGEWKYYLKDGNVDKIKVYEDGELVDEPEEETVNQTDTNGKKTGVWETKHKNGNIKERGEYENNKRVGVWETKHDNGNLFKRGGYVNGIAEGEWKFYDKSEKLKTTGKYVNGIAEGEWKIYNPDGEEIATKFENGKQIITLDVDIKEEDIIRDYKNKKYNIGKFVYDKKNDEFIFIKEDKWCC